MSIDRFSQYRLFNKGSRYYDSGIATFIPPGRALEFSGWRDEQQSWKTACYIGDWTHNLAELKVKGPDALKFLADISINSYAKFAIGQGKHIVQCNRNGEVAAEGVVLRLAEEEFVIESNIFWAHYNFVTAQPRYNAEASYVVSDYNGMKTIGERFKFQVSGPKALYLLEKVTEQNLKSVGFMRFEPIRIRNHSLIALRMGMAGEVGFELQGPIEHANEIHQAIFEAGQEFGIRRLGKRTSMINHLEACFPTGWFHYVPAVYDDDTREYREHLKKHSTLGLTPTIVGSFEGESIADYYRSPIELGWGKSIKFDHPFTGRAALEKEVASPKRTIVTLEFNSDDVIDIYASMFRSGEPYDMLEIPYPPAWVAHTDQALKDGELIGVSTTPGYSYHFRKVLALAYLGVKHTQPGTQVTIVWGNPGTPQKHVRATVAAAPYKKDNRFTDLSRLQT
jgi:vanillate/3-O-methylgallate O-demethylase